MALQFQRSLLTRYVEALVRDFLANEDVQSYWKARVYKGPFNGDEASVVVPQIGVIPAPGAARVEPGTSGVVPDFAMSALVVSYEAVRRGPWESGGTSLDQYDRLDLLKRIIARGSNDGESPGKIIDPDNAESSDSTQKYLNTTVATFDDRPPRLITRRDGGIVAEAWQFLATVTTRIDNTTLLRR